jgi:hypothetical protein
VLREASRPFKNLLEYHGIWADRLERMEARLRVGGPLAYVLQDGAQVPECCVLAA